MSRHQKTYEANQHARFMRPDASRWMRSDAERWLKPQHPDELKYSPNQPRVPAGQTGGGQWTNGADGNGTNDSRVISDATPDNFWQPGAELANIIPVCILSGVSRTVNYFGLKEFSALYDCADGRIARRSGVGHNPPGIIRDPFR